MKLMTLFRGDIDQETDDIEVGGWEEILSNQNKLMVSIKSLLLGRQFITFACSVLTAIP